MVNINNEEGSQFEREIELQKQVHNVHNVHKKLGEDPPSPLEDKLQKARDTCKIAIKDAKEDPIAHLNQEVINAFKVIYDNDSLEYERLRTELKRANNLIRIGVIDTHVKPVSESARTSQATELSDLAAESCELWHDADSRAYATFERLTDFGTHKENWPIDSNGFRDWLAWLAHTELGCAPSSDTIKSVSNTLAGCAKFDGKEYKIFKRIAHNEEGYWIDLCNDEWSAILVTSEGHQLVKEPQVKFIRTKSMWPLPMPAEEGDISELWNLVNIPEEDRIFILAWMLEAFRKNTPYPVLELIGEQGSAKSTTQRVIRQFIDPNRAPLRAAPKSREELFIAAANAHLVSLENLSGLSPEYSDALCTICTGGGTAARTHYTNGEESILEAKNPIILNGIGANITRPDLLDRSIIITLPVIKDRFTEMEHAARLEKGAPRIMKALLDIFIGALSKLPSVNVSSDQLQRMADFTLLGEAINLHLNRPSGEFVQKYKQHRQDSIRRIIDASPVATACINFVGNNQNYASTVKNLHEILTECMDSKKLDKGDYWPKSPRGFADALRRIAPALRQIGIDCSIEPKQRRDGYHCYLKKIEEEQSEVII